MKNHSALKLSLLWSLVVLILSPLLSSCQTAPSDSVSGTQIPASETPVAGVSTYVMASYIKATSIQELTTKSTIVIIARAGEKDGIFNMARDVNDPSKPDPELFGVGQIYSFEVIRYLKGKETVVGVKEIHIAQVEGLFEITPQASPSTDEIEKARAVYDYTSFKPGGEYILFLIPLPYFPDLKNYFMPVGPTPWKFVLIDQCTYPESPWRGATDYFHPQLIDGFVKTIESSLSLGIKSITPVAYPPPDDASSSTCQVVPTGIAAYP